MAIIRKAVLEDAALITRLTSTVQNLHAGMSPTIYRPVAPDDPAIFEHVCHRLQQDDHVFYIAEEDGDAVGLMLCCIRIGETNPYSFPRKVLVIDQISVEEAYRGTGVADTLIQQAFDLARQHKISRISLGVLAWNERAIAFYKKYGFEIEQMRMVTHLE